MSPVDEIPYYVYDEDEKSHKMSENGEAYIDDEDLKELLLDLLGDKVSEKEIQEILKAASDDKISEEEFDEILDDFILNHKS